MFSIIRLKKFLIALLALAIPLQACAAAAMILCDSGQATALSTAAITDVKPHHHVDLQKSDLRATSTPDEYHNDAPDASTHSCDSCASCCLGVIPVPTSLSAVQALPGTHATALAPSGFVGYTPENPERPPSRFI